MPNKRGQPKRFTSEDQFVKAMSDYLDIEKVFPNIAGFCVFAKINRETYYEYRTYYPNSFKTVDEMLENAVLHIDPKYAARVIFYMKNKHGYRDIQEQTISVPEPVTINYSKLGTDDLMTLRAIAEKAKDDNTKV